MSIRTQQKNLEFFLRYRADCPDRVIGDPGRVRQILFNLCSNAIKFTEKGHVLLDIDIIESSDKSAKIRITVEDTGIGIEDAKLARIFNKFDQADTTTTRRYGGTGLGLSISRQLTEMMGGQIAVRSKLGSGTIFYCDIPFGLPSGNGYQSTYSRKNFVDLGLRVLVVDDNEIFCEILRDVLSAVGFIVSVERDSTKVVDVLLQAASSNPYDFVILDYVMPKYSGIDVAQKISKHPELSGIQSILATSQPTRSDAEAIRQVGIKGYITKPIRPSELLAIISTLWEAKQKKVDIDVVTRYTVREHDLKSDGSAIGFENVSVLMAEDNVINQEVIAAILLEYGIETTIAENGKIAVEKVAAGKFDLIFMDCHMPEMDGYDATKAIRQIENIPVDLPIIAMTANVMKGDREKCIAAGMNDYIGKPLKEDELKEILLKWLPAYKRTIRTSDDKSVQGSGGYKAEAVINPKVIDKVQRIMGEKFGDILNKFLLTSDGAVKRIDEALKAGDVKEIEEAAHLMKSCGQFGADNLYRLAGQLESYARSADTVRIPQTIDALKAELQAVRQEILNIRGQS